MPLEATMICLDNSEWMRNGDYSPTRLQAQVETVNYIANAKIQDNQESEVGLLSMAGPRVEVHCSMSRSMGQIMTCMQKDLKIGGESQFVSGLKIAQLGLKNRQNKNQKQRIIMFVGSPITEETKILVKLGKVFKKNNVSVDVINFGAENSLNENAEKLEAFVAAINSGDSSHLVNIPPGPHVLADLVLTSSIMVSTPGAAAAAGAGAAAAMGGEMDANMDQDLAMAIRMSMEDERQRQERAGGDTEGAAAATPAPAVPVVMEDDEDEDDEDELLAQAIALSMAADIDDAPEEPEAKEEPTEAKKEEDKKEDEEDEISAALKDKAFLENLLSSIPGMDKNELAIDDILMSLGGDDGEEEDKDKKK